MSEKLGARLRDPKCRCGWLKRVFPSGIMVCFLCDQVHLIPNAQPNIMTLRPSSQPPSAIPGDSASSTSTDG